jgi:RNA polymerase sigma factor (sigma-70 family)
MTDRNPLDDFIAEDAAEDGDSTAYELYRLDMDAKFHKLDSEELETLHVTWTSQGDKFAHEKLVHALLPLVPHVCGRLRTYYGQPNPDQWDDCIQAGNVALLQAIQSWNAEGGKSLPSWVCQYVVRDVGRQIAFLTENKGFAYSRERQHNDYDGSDAAYSDENENSDEGEQAKQMEREVDIRNVRDNLHKLSDQQRNVVNLLLSGKSLADAARGLGITRQAAFALHERAIQELRQVVLTNT